MLPTYIFNDKYRRNITVLESCAICRFNAEHNCVFTIKFTTVNFIYNILSFIQCTLCIFFRLFKFLRHC